MNNFKLLSAFILCWSLASCSGSDNEGGSDSGPSGDSDITTPSVNPDLGDDGTAPISTTYDPIEVKDVIPATNITSSFVVSGLPSSAPVAFSVDTCPTECSFKIMRGGFLDVTGSAQVRNSDVVDVTVLSSSEFETDVSVDLSIGEQSKNISVSTISEIVPKGPDLPIEVLGEEGHVVNATMTLTAEQARNARKIFFYANSLSYQNKGSISINGGPWTRLNNFSVDLYEKERHFKGMQHGGMSSIRFTIPADGLLNTGENRLSFRFDVSDGISIGYRIFRVNILDIDDQPLIAEESFANEDPLTWSAPEGFEDEQSVAEGESLWRARNSLWNHYLPKPRKANWYANDLLDRRRIKAACSDCHTQDGRDLQYFSYSNHSIIERSKFHGLSEEQGQKVAAYIRSLDVRSLGRPWNPPYQPGPSVGEKSIEHWAAGAGIDAVLEKDADMLPYLFPNGTSQEEVDAYFDSEKMYDTTTVPLALQFPDWKRWLPMIHPLDAFDEFYAIQNSDGSFSPGLAEEKLNPLVQYPPLREFLENNDHDALVAKQDEFYPLLGNFWKAYRKFFTKEIGKGGGWRYSNAVADSYMPSQEPGFGQFARTSLARLMSVQFFEFHQEFKLEELTQRLIHEVNQPAPRQWLHALGYNIFEVPPHFTAGAFGSTAAYEGQAWLVGVLETTTWYEMQLVLNPGNGRPGGVGPVDFNYVPGFIRKLSGQGRPHPLRYFRAMNNAYQVKSFVEGISSFYDEGEEEESTSIDDDNSTTSQGDFASEDTTTGDSVNDDPDAEDPVEDIDPDKTKGFRMLQQGPWNLMVWNAPQYPGTGFIEKLNDVEDGLALKVLNAMASQLADELDKPKNDPSTYKRSNKPKQFSLHKETKDSYNPNHGKNHFADRFYIYMQRFNDFGVEPERVNRIIDWCEQAWPLMPWGDIRPAVD